MSIVWRDATICDGGLSKVWRGMRQSAMVVEVLIRRRVATLLLEYRMRQAPNSLGTLWLRSNQSVTRLLLM